MEGEVKCFKHVLVPRLFSYTQTTTIATILLEKSQNRIEHLAHVGVGAIGRVSYISLKCQLLN